MSFSFFMCCISHLLLLSTENKFESDIIFIGKVGSFFANFALIQHLKRKSLHFETKIVKKTSADYTAKHLNATHPIYPKQVSVA